MMIVLRQVSVTIVFFVIVDHNHTPTNKVIDDSNCVASCNVNLTKHCHVSLFI